MTLTAVTVAYNERHTIDLAIKSIANTADSLIVVDNGSDDDTLDVAQQAADEAGIPAEFYAEPRLDLAGVRQYAIERALDQDPDWVWIVDADHVIRDTHAVEELTEGRPYEPTFHCFRYINLYGDFRHAWGNQPVAPPHIALISADAPIIHARYGGRRNLPIMPKHSRVDHGIYAVNCNGLKSAERLFYRQGFIEWQETANDFDTPKAYWMDKHGLETEAELAEAAREVMLRRFANQCEPLSDHFDEPAEELLPPVIVEELDAPRFELVYRDGQVVGRTPDLPPE